MDTLAAIGADAPEIPRFDDGMVNINERLIRELIRTPSLFLKTQLDACG